MADNEDRREDLRADECSGCHTAPTAKEAPDLFPALDGFGYRSADRRHLAFMHVVLRGARSVATDQSADWLGDAANSAGS
jgi:hypothetical protein